MNKLHNKDFSIAFKTGSDEGRLKFKKEAVQGELYFAVDSQTLYVAETTAGATDATLAKFSNIVPLPPLNNITVVDTEDNIISTNPANPEGSVNIRYAKDSDYLYVYDGVYWYRFFNN